MIVTGRGRMILSPGFCVAVMIICGLGRSLPGSRYRRDGRLTATQDQIGDDDHEQEQAGTTADADVHVAPMVTCEPPTRTMDSTHARMNRARPTAIQLMPRHRGAGSAGAVTVVTAAMMNDRPARQATMKLTEFKGGPPRRFYDSSGGRCYAVDLCYGVMFGL